MRIDFDNLLSRRSALALWIGFGATAFTQYGCSPRESASRANETPPRLTLMRDKARAAQAARPDKRARKASAGQTPLL
jgi:hypothetical protein